MLEWQVKHAKNYLTKAKTGLNQEIKFVTPVASTILAAGSPFSSSFQFIGEADTYASRNNLKCVLDGGEYRIPDNSGQQGITYTKLTKLMTHSEVDWCNKLISDLIYNWFSPYSTKAASLMASVVGELHDNVPSHALGPGYSCVQVYRKNQIPSVVFAIADRGCGMLKNVKKVKNDISNQQDAISWCIQKGNTSAKPVDEWAQRLPEDAHFSPYPIGVKAFSEGNHHAGHGLWKLSEMVKDFHGKVWILSGQNGDCAEYWYNSGKESCNNVKLQWNGVAIAFELTVPEGEVASVDQEASLNELGRRLGL